MRNALLLITAFSLFLFACKDSGTPTDRPSVDNDTDTLTSDEWKKYPEVGPEEVKQMAAHYKTLKHDINTNIIQMITMNGPLLRKLLKNQKRIRFITAAYLKDNPYGQKDKLTVIIQLIKERSEKKVYYDMNSIFMMTMSGGENEGICPPPIDCNPTESFDSNF